MGAIENFRALQASLNAAIDEYVRLAETSLGGVETVKADNVQYTNTQRSYCSCAHRGSLWRMLCSVTAAVYCSFCLGYPACRSKVQIDGSIVFSEHGNQDSH